MCPPATRGVFAIRTSHAKSIRINAMSYVRNWHCSCVVYHMKGGHTEVVVRRSLGSGEGRHMVDRAMQAQVELEQEPVGIVISRGSRDEATPRFSAYVWGPPDEPETTMTSGSHRAA